MNRAEEVELFVHRCFDMYGLSFKQFFGDMFDEEIDEDGNFFGGHLEELPLALGEDINMELLVQAATTLGVSPEALMQMDDDAVQCWYVKYPYFQLRKQFNAARYHSLNFASAPGEMTLDAIFNDNYSPENHIRYKGNIKARLVELLKEYDRVMPGCFHEGAEMTELTIQTNNFTNFEPINELADAYLSLVSRARELFYKLWNEELPDAEVKEYNFLVSVLGMRDVGYAPSEPIYYETARKFAPVYKQEGYSDYASYIKYRGADFPEFYACKEFYDNPDLVERMVREFPDMKAQIGEMAIMAKNFYCSFVWSDEPKTHIDDSFEDYLLDVLQEDYSLDSLQEDYSLDSLQEDYPLNALQESDEDTPSWYHRVYVPKTQDELHGDEKYIAICERLSAPASQGGIKVPVPECIQKHDVGLKRFIARCM